MTKDRTWLDNASRVGVVLLSVDVCLFIAKSFLFSRLFGRHDDVLVLSSEIGFLVSIVAFFLVLLVRRTTLRIGLGVVSAILGYLWFSSAIWWVMKK